MSAMSTSAKKRPRKRWWPTEEGSIIQYSAPLPPLAAREAIFQGLTPPPLPVCRKTAKGPESLMKREGFFHQPERGKWMDVFTCQDPDRRPFIQRAEWSSDMMKLEGRAKETSNKPWLLILHICLIWPTSPLVANSPMLLAGFLLSMRAIPIMHMLLSYIAKFCSGNPKKPLKARKQEQWNSTVYAHFFVFSYMPIWFSASTVVVVVVVVVV